MKEPKITISNGCMVFLCAYGIFDPIGSFLPFILSVTAHELGHILAIRLMKQKIQEIRGTAGGFEILTLPLSYGQEILIAAAGPMVNLLILLLTLGRLPVVTLVNGVLLGYNILPFYPMDGGRILRGCLGLWLPPETATVIERWICICTFSIMVIGSLYLTFGLHNGLWPVIFCGVLFSRMGELILPCRKTFP